MEKVCVCVCADYYAAHRRSRSELDLPVSVEQSVHDEPLLDEHSSGQLDRDGKFMGSGLGSMVAHSAKLILPNGKGIRGRAQYLFASLQQWGGRWNPSPYRSNMELQQALDGKSPSENV